MAEAALNPTEFERLTRPLKRLKVSLVWHNVIRNRDTAQGMRSLAAVAGLSLAWPYDAVLEQLEKNPEHVSFSTLSFELGSLEKTRRLSTPSRPLAPANLSYYGASQKQGQASLDFGRWWRVESPRAITFSSETDPKEIEEELQSFTGRRVVDVQVTGRLPELIVCFSRRRWIQSFADYSQPCWQISLPDSSWIGSKSGRLVRGGL